MLSACADARVRSTVTLVIPKQRAISRLLDLSLKCIALILAYLSTENSTQSLRWPVFR